MRSSYRPVEGGFSVGRLKEREGGEGKDVPHMMKSDVSLNVLCELDSITYSQSPKRKETQSVRTSKRRKEKERLKRKEKKKKGGKRTRLSAVGHQEMWTERLDLVFVTLHLHNCPPSQTPKKERINR